jgi:putative addiction module killer protein
LYPIGYNRHMNTIHSTEEFEAWLVGLKDIVSRAKILVRIDRARNGNFGDTEPVGDGVHEMRIHFGPGYRVYYAREGRIVYLLLSGETNQHSKPTSSGQRQPGMTSSRSKSHEH